MPREGHTDVMPRSVLVMGLLTIFAVGGAILYATSWLLDWLGLRVVASPVIVAEAGSPLEGWMWLLNATLPVALVLFSFFMILEYYSDPEPMPFVPPHLMMGNEYEIGENGDGENEADNADE